MAMRITTGRLARIPLALALACGAVTPAWGGERPLGHYAHVSAQELAQWRGGWRNDEGVWVRFGLESTLRVDGELIGGAQWGPVRLSMDSLDSVRSAAPVVQQLSDGVAMEGVEFRQSMSSQGLVMTLQNTVNHRVIQHLQGMDVQLGGVDLGPAYRSGEVLQGQLVGALR
ncbi:hypothetical protein [Halorhodospira neutriphila]|uniref:Type II secretion system protein N n=1 Tax=Halorhodospira neutriphila TaxID=168379 RepID=A0ABS1E7D0_9GAMM|nr:hypothetical protein [Halorhodospira neutriphila]MBK1726189.1 hypothetical protein [Halorhodospira neutriphila]